MEDIEISGSEEEKKGTRIERQNERKAERKK